MRKAFPRAQMLEEKPFVLIEGFELLKLMFVGAKDNNPNAVFA